MGHLERRRAWSIFRSRRAALRRLTAPDLRDRIEESLQYLESFGGRAARASCGRSATVAERPHCGLSGEQKAEVEGSAVRSVISVDNQQPRGNNRNTQTEPLEFRINPKQITIS